MIEQHAQHSVLRERIVEHLIVGEMLKRFWSVGNTGVEILRSEFDRGGYDLVVDFGSVTRHIQLKSSREGSRTAEQTVSMNLAAKPSGCVIWAVVSDQLDFRHFFWFGGDPGDPLPPIADFGVAKHVKANALGQRLARPNLRQVRRSKFQRLETLDDLLDKLFGQDWRSPANAPELGNATPV